MIFRKNSAAGPKEILILKIQMAFCVQFVASTSNININALHSMSSQTAIPFSFLQGYCSKTAEEEEKKKKKTLWSDLHLSYSSSFIVSDKVHPAKHGMAFTCLDYH